MITASRATRSPWGEPGILAAGYTEQGVVGYVYPSQMKGTKPLKLFWSPARQDNITVSSQQGQMDAQAAGYTFVRNEGYVIY